ncbi:HutD/Ves family protein [Arthrobacter cavernae]|uniref:HutD family protein n=1 Tax=Arthrobacter cavernae TaxID=2817681 RepID=A0A939KN46_9MICC|nr:HutD family protein [Arthrobacter cavernae]MBO1267270.1 HutD family protein [Arthrobacter cavernae]
MVSFAGLGSVPWLNGGGSTREIAAGTAGDPRAGGSHAGWDWRLSVAEVRAPGPFSHFPGTTRILTVIEGGPLGLVVDGVGHSPGRFRPFIFDGGAKTEASLLAGPVRNLNLIFMTGTMNGSVRVETLSGPEMELQTGQMAVLFEGHAAVEGHQLALLDTVLAAPSPRTVHGKGRLAVITLGTV